MAAAHLCTLRGEIDASMVVGELEWLFRGWSAAYVAHCTWWGAFTQAQLLHFFPFTHITTQRLPTYEGEVEHFLANGACLKASCKQSLFAPLHICVVNAFTCKQMPTCALVICKCKQMLLHICKINKRQKKTASVTPARRRRCCDDAQKTRWW